MAGAILIDVAAVPLTAAATGALVWQYPTMSYILSSPTVVNDVVFFGSSDGNLYALKAQTGALLWKYNIGTDVDSPAVANGVLYVGARDGNLYAFHLSH